MDKFFLSVISLIAVVSMVAIVGIVFEGNSATDRNMVGHDLHLDNVPYDMTRKGVSASVESEHEPNMVGYDIYLHSPRGSNSRLGSSDDSRE